MKKVFVAMAAVVGAMALPSMAADKVQARSTPTICEGKSSAEHYVKTLSDYELAGSMLNIMSDARLLSLKSAHDVGVWLHDHEQDWPGLVALEPHLEPAGRTTRRTLDCLDHLS